MRIPTSSSFFQLDFFIMFIGLARSRYDACYVVLYIHVCSVLANHDLVLLLNLFT